MSIPTRKTGHGQDLLLLAAIAVPLLAVVFFYLSTRLDLDRRYPVQAAEIAVPGGAAAIAEGERLSRIRGCFWCHGQGLEGQQYFAEADRGIIAVAPNLTRKVREYTPAEFAYAVRHGVRPDGTSLQPAMPSFAFFNISDTDMGLMLAYINSLPERQGLTGEFRLMPLGWIRWGLDELPPPVAELIDHDAPRTPPAVNGGASARGEYLAMSICTECHGDNGRLRVPVTPDLEVAVAYSRDEFFELMRTGQPRHDRPIDYHMVDASKYRYTHLTDQEIGAMYSYFRSMLEPGIAAATSSGD